MQLDKENPSGQVSREQIESATRDLNWFLIKKNQGTDLSKDKMLEAFDGDEKKLNEFQAKIDAATQSMLDAQSQILGLQKKIEEKRATTDHLSEVQLQASLSTFLSTKPISSSKELKAAIDEFVSTHPDIEFEITPNSWAMKPLKKAPHTIVKNFIFNGSAFAVTVDCNHGRKDIAIYKNSNGPRPYWDTAREYDIAA